MKEFKIPNKESAEAWCLKYIGPRLYYLHNSTGGQGWRLKKSYSYTLLCIEDDKKALMAMLTLSER